jgi:LmbE family N-acetylglucosaminyl deacetylase
MKKTVMAIGAHFDDVELECGGTLARLIEKGWDCVYVVATTTPHYNQTLEEKSSGKMPSNEEIINIRKDESRRAAKILGIEDVHFWDFKSAYYYTPGTTQRWDLFGMSDERKEYDMLIDRIPGRELMLTAARNPKSLDFVADFINIYKPDMILTHTPADKHCEHYATAILVHQALRTRVKNSSIDIYAFQEASQEPLINIHMSHFCDITDHFHKKLQSLNTFRSQYVNQEFTPERFQNIYTLKATVYGKLAGVKYAEAFTCFEPFFANESDYWRHFLSSDHNRNSYISSNKRWLPEI